MEAVPVCARRAPVAGSCDATMPGFSSHHPPSKWFDLLWYLAWGVASSIWCVTAAGQLGATYDEPNYIATGLERWHSGSTTCLMRLGTMPLPVDAETGPLYLWERWRGTPIDLNTEWERVLPWARAGNLVFWWLLLGYGWLAGRFLAGPWAGRLAVALLACEPTFLGHASLATTDIAVAASLLALTYHFRTGMNTGWLRRVGWPAFWFAAAVLAKASGLVFGVICLCAVELEQRLTCGAQERTAGNRRGLWSILWHQRPSAPAPFRRDCLQIVFLGLALVFIYCGTDWEPQTSWFAWARKLPPSPQASVMVWLAGHLRIFSNAGDAITRQVRHNVCGHGVYILGQRYERAVWYYFPLVLTIKLTLGLLIAPLVVAVLRGRSLRNWALAATVALLLFSFLCRVQIGVRFMLPLVALAVVGLSAAVVETVRALGPGWRARFLVGASTVAVLHGAVVLFTLWPYGLCYVNELWGGTPAGYQLVSDSNYDWGQGLKELAAWQRAHGGRKLAIWYYGTDPALKMLRVEPLSLHAIPFRNADEVGRLLQGRTLAVGTSAGYGYVAGVNVDAVWEYLAHSPVTARTSTFLIYDFSGSLKEESRADAGTGSM
jgi:hypothetical protein